MYFEKYTKYKKKYLQLQKSYENNLNGGTSRMITQKGGAFRIITNDKYSSGETDEELRGIAHVQGKAMVDKWLATNTPNIDRILALFDDNGLPNKPPSATTFSDLYKFTMMPVIRKLEEYKGGNITVTFGVDLREPTMREELKKSAELRNNILCALKTLETRKFDRAVFDKINSAFNRDVNAAGQRDVSKNLIDADTIDAICGPEGNPRTLVDKDGVKPFGAYNRTAADDNKVTVTFYENSEAVYEEGAEPGVYFIEATGPWHKVTWLETSMMQCVYETKLRYDLAKKGISYSEWIYGALLRCAKSVAYTRQIQQRYPAKNIKPALFTGRRTGGFIFLLLQNMFFADHFIQLGITPEPQSIKTLCIGTSSVDSWCLLTNKNLPCLVPVGTHAHELSMVTSVLFPQLDYNNKYRLPFTQIIGHYLYYKLVISKTKGLMAMLPDTLGTRAFMKAANMVTIKIADGPIQKFLDVITSARQDSGKLQDFIDNMTEFGYNRAIMASEIDTTDTLLSAAIKGYNSFGAGGFFGDSEKVWGDKAAKSNSMAVKAVRVVYQRTADLQYNEIPYIVLDEGTGKVTGYPIKIGDPDEKLQRTLKNGKLSLDKNLPAAKLALIKNYAQEVRERAVNFSSDEKCTQISLEQFFTVDAGLKIIDFSRI